MWLGVATGLVLALAVAAGSTAAILIASIQGPEKTRYPHVTASERTASAALAPTLQANVTAAPAPPQAGQPTWHISETFSAGQFQVILEDGVNTYTVASREPGIAEFDKWEMAYVTDLAADGVDDAVVMYFTGGAHCCFEYLIFSEAPNGIHLDDWFSLGDATIGAVKDLDGDGILELETGDNRLAYFPDLSFADSPFLPLVLCRSAQATYSDCTPHFPEKLQESADGYERQLSDAVQHQVGEEEKRGAALGLLASYLRLGKDEEGWATVRRLCPECEAWLLLNFGELEQRLRWPQPSRTQGAQLSALGFTPSGSDVSTPDGSSGSLNAVKGICAGSPDGYCQQVFFFHNGEYLGTDTFSPSRSILDLQYADVAKIAVTYANYAPSDGLCCPSLSPVTITYHWDGQRLIPSGTPPDQGAAATITLTPVPTRSGDGEIGLAHIWTGLGVASSCWDVGLEDQTQCIIDEAETSGASREAVAFFSEHEWFLETFEEKGAVDWGLVWHPLVDQTRSHPAFLNGTPSVLIIDDALGSVNDLDPDAMTYGEGVLAFIEGGEETLEEATKPLIVWPQYGTLQTVHRGVVSTSWAGDVSGQAFVVSIPLKECRACPTERELTVGFIFDDAGSYLGRGVWQ